MISKEIIGKELYVWIWERGIKKLLYKRWLDKDYGVVMDRQPFTAKDTESFKQSITMMKLEYVDETTFEKKEQIYTDFHFALAANIKENLCNSYEKDTITEILADKDGKLIFGVLRNRLNGETCAEKYKITIEKL